MLADEAEQRRAADRAAIRRAWQRELILNDIRGEVPKEEYEKQIAELRAALIQVEGSRTWKYSRKVARVGKAVLHRTRAISCPPARSRAASPRAPAAPQARHGEHGAPHAPGLHVDARAATSSRGSPRTACRRSRGGPRPDLVHVAAMPTSCAAGSPTRTTPTTCSCGARTTTATSSAVRAQPSACACARGAAGEPLVGRRQTASSSTPAACRRRRSAPGASAGSPGPRSSAARDAVGDDRLVLLVDRGLEELPDELAGSCRQITRIDERELPAYGVLVQPSPMTASAQPLVPILHSTAHQARRGLRLHPDAPPDGLPARRRRRGPSTRRHWTPCACYDEFVCISHLVQAELGTLLGRPAEGPDALVSHVAWPRDVLPAGARRDRPGRRPGRSS